MAFLRVAHGYLMCDDARCFARYPEAEADINITSYLLAVEGAEENGWLIKQKPARHYCPNCRAKHEPKAKEQGNAV